MVRAQSTRRKSQAAAVAVLRWLCTLANISFFVEIYGVVSTAFVSRGGSGVVGIHPPAAGMESSYAVLVAADVVGGAGELVRRESSGQRVLNSRPRCSTCCMQGLVGAGLFKNNGGVDAGVEDTLVQRSRLLRVSEERLSA